MSRAACWRTVALALACRGRGRSRSSGSTQPAAPTAPARCNLPENPQLFGTAMPSVVKATAIVNGEIITQTDVDQRLALLAIANGGKSRPTRSTACASRCCAT